MLKLSPVYQLYLLGTATTRRITRAYYVRAGRDMVRMPSILQRNIDTAVGYVGNTPANTEAQTAVQAMKAETIPLARIITSGDAATFNSKETRPNGETFTDVDWRTAGVVDQEDLITAMIRADDARVRAETAVNAAIVDTQNRRIAQGQTNKVETTSASGQTVIVEVPVKPIPAASLPTPGPIVTQAPSALQAAQALASTVATRAGEVVDATIGGWVNMLKIAPTLLIVGGVGFGLWWAYRKLR